jgi:hypothetical protein
MPTELSEHKADRCQSQESQGITGQIFKVFGQTTTAIEPREGSFDNPALWQNLERPGTIRPFHNDRRQLRQDAGEGLLEQRPLITAIGEELAQEREHAEQSLHNHDAAVAILNVGLVHDGVKQEP